MGSREEGEEPHRNQTCDTGGTDRNGTGTSSAAGLLPPSSHVTLRIDVIRLL